MKTIAELKKENEEIIKDAGPSYLIQKRVKSKIEKRLLKNKEIITALETGFSESYFEKQIQKQKRKLEIFESKFSVWRKNTPNDQLGTNPQKTYNSIMGVTKIKQQILFLKSVIN